MLQQHAVKLLFQQRGRPIINQTMLKHNQSKWNHGESLLFHARQIIRTMSNTVSPCKFLGKSINLIGPS